MIALKFATIHNPIRKIKLTCATSSFAAYQTFGRYLMRKSRSVQSTLQIAFFSILILIFLLYMTYYVVIESSKIRSQAIDTIQQNVISASAYIDSDINALDTVMQNIAYSNLVKEQYSAYLNKSDSSKDGNYSSMQNSKVLTNLLTAIIGPNRPVDQIYLYALDKGSFGIGLDNSTSSTSVTDQYWYDDLVNSPKNKIFFSDKDPRLEKYFSYDDGSRFFTLCSIYQSNLYKPIGVIEVKRSISPLIKQLETIELSSLGQKIYIYDKNGALVYQSDKQSDEAALFDDISQNIEPDSFDKVNYLRLNNVRYFYKTSSYSHITTVICVTDAQMYASMMRFISNNIIIFIVIALFTFIASYVVSRIITNPLMKMYAQLQSLHTTDNISQNEETIDRIDTHIIELDTLYSALIDMHERAQTSMKREITLHNQEIQSRMLALQSQMNPHFLYNSLATIQSMADEEMNEEIIEMCQSISRILRYISSNSDQLVPIGMDLEHACDYLLCMKMRYDDDLEWQIDIPDEMKSMLIPKLCLQLIVENSIKYSTKAVRPPWKIQIVGSIAENYWEISVMDNGIGFSEEELQLLNEKIAFINDNDLLPSLEINGMGLMNIYIRFKILYNGNHIFRINNLPSGGAIVTIGGEIMDGT